MRRMSAALGCLPPLSHDVRQVLADIDAFPIDYYGRGGGQARSVSSGRRRLQQAERLTVPSTNLLPEQERADIPGPTHAD